MKIFVIMLLLANLAGWGWVVWAQPARMAPPPLGLADLAFLGARHELQLLDNANAVERFTPKTGAEVDAQVVVQDAVASQADSMSESRSLAAAVPEMWCGLSAVFQTELEASNWLSDWSRLGGAGSLIVMEEPVSSTWWVHLPPFPAESEARVILNELQGKKIDSFYMRTGELAGGISLGVFSRKESAFLVQADLEKRGYSATVKEILRKANRFQVALELREKALLQLPEMQALLSNQSYGEVHEIPCR